MNEENDDNQLDDFSNLKYLKGISDLEEEKHLKTKWTKEIKESKAIQAFFEQYNSSSVNSFIKSYVLQKYQAFKFADLYASELERQETLWIYQAEKHLEVILQKKLFDLQCAWRAEQIELEGVEICFDFTVFEHDIFNCTIIDEITQEEIELYSDFLKSGNASRYDDGEWQDYLAYKEEYISDTDESSIPEWYEYHNLKTGKGSLLLLPDIRGEKEEFYIDLFREESRKEYEKEQAENPTVYDKRPYLSSYEDDILNLFYTSFENREFRKLWKNYRLYSKRSEDGMNEHLEEMLREMGKATENIPIEGHYDYAQAIELAYNKYFFGKIAECLPIAHQQYLFNKQMNLSPTKERYDDFYPDLRKKYCENILKGRELNGEPRNLDF